MPRAAGPVTGAGRMGGRRFFWILAGLLAAGTLLVPSAHGADAPGRPRVGLVLSGGGARGTAHIGVLQVLEQHRIPVDCIAGTSMGALVGGLYAAGLSAAQLDSLAVATDWSEIFADNIPRHDRTFRRKRDDDLYVLKLKLGLRSWRLILPPGILAGHRIDLLLKRLTIPVVATRDFDQLGIPFRAVAADIATGEPVVLDRGDLARAIRASASIPAVFTPTEVDGRLLVDGGIVNTIPVDVARDMGADIVIVVDIAPPPRRREQLASVADVVRQLTALASKWNSEERLASLAKRDVLIRPDLGSITGASFDQVGAAVEIGRAAAERAIGRLDGLALPPREYERHRARRVERLLAADSLTVAATRIVNPSRLADEVLSARLDVPTGVPMSAARLEHGVNQLYGLDLFESVYYDLAPGPAGDVLTVTARERTRGPAYLQAGVAVFEDFERPDFGFAVVHSRTAMNRLNGEWRTALEIGREHGVWTEFHQPLDLTLRSFADLDLRAGERALNVFDAGGHARSELGITQFGGTLAVGRELGNWGELRAGVVREGGRICVRTGDPVPAVGRYDTGELFGQAYVDELDDPAFPRRGGSLRVRLSAGLKRLGSATEYEQVDVRGALAATRGRMTGTVGAWFAGTRHSDAPLESRFSLGGFGRLSGLHQDERMGQHALLLQSRLYRRIADFQFQPVYAGVSVEYGNVFSTRPAIGLAGGIAAAGAFLGCDTLIGPLCLAYGFAEGGRTSWYLTLGEPLAGRRPRFGVH